jgi:hypothetical protein
MAARLYIDLLKVRERALALLLNRPADSKPRSLTELEGVAARQIAREQRRAGQAKPVDDTKITADNAQEHLFAKIWRVVQSMNAAADKPAPKPIEPNVIHNPVVVTELPQSNLTQYPSDAVLVSAPFSHAKLISDAEFPVRFVDQTTAAWRNSILENESRARERQRRSAIFQTQQRSKYVG